MEPMGGHPTWRPYRDNPNGIISPPSPIGTTNMGPHPKTNTNITPNPIIFSHKCSRIEKIWGQYEGMEPMGGHPTWRPYRYNQDGTTPPKQHHHHPKSHPTPTPSPKTDAPSVGPLTGVKSGALQAFVMAKKSATSFPSGPRRSLAASPS